MRNFFRCALVFFLVSCSGNSIVEETVSTSSENNRWVNVEEPYPEGQDGMFPLVNKPIYKSVHEMTELKDTDKVAIVSYHNKIKVYPYLYTNKSEIVNDSIEGFYYAVSYCPQTKSAVNYNRITANDTLDLVASGYLYKDNMVPSDDKYNFYWSQMLMKGITSDADGLNLQTLNLIQTNWKTVVDYFPNAKVYYYEGEIITPAIYDENITIEKSSGTPTNADDVFGIVDNFNNSVRELSLIAFPLDKFSETTSFQELTVDSEKVVLIGNKKHSFYTTYKVPLNLVLHLENSNFPPTLGDNEGNKWNAFGYAFDGPRKGQQLASSKSYIASWWAWKDFFENIEIK